MRRLLFLLPLLLPFLARAQTTNINALVTFTNLASGVTNGQTITGNGDVRTYTNNVSASPSTRIQATNSVGRAATNTWLQLSTYRIANVDRVYTTNTNQIVIQGSLNQTLTVTLSANVGTVSYATNVYSAYTPVVYPAGGIPVEAGRTQNVSGLIALLNDARSTQAVNNGVAAFSNLLDVVTAQIASNKLFWATTNRGSYISNSLLHNVSGTNLYFTNVVLKWAELTNYTLRGFGVLPDGFTVSNSIVSYGDIGIYSPGSQIDFGGGSSIAFEGSGFTFYTGNTNGAQLNHDGARIQGMLWVNTILVTNSLSTSNLVVSNAVAMLSSSASIDFNTAGEVRNNGGLLEITGSLVLPALAGSGLNVIYVDDNGLLNTGPGDSVITTNLTVKNLGTFGGIIATNMQTTAGATNTIRGDVAFPRATITTIANGHNTLGLNTNVFVDLTGSPSVAWTLGGFSGGNRDGKWVQLRNLTGYSAEILDNSGTEPTAGNRIDTPLGSPITWASGSFAQFIYDASASRWALQNVFSGSSTAGLDIAGTNTFFPPALIAQMGAHLWTDGTNLCVVFQNSAGTRTTNKLSMAAWP